MYKKILGDDLEVFFESLKKFGNVQGPVSIGGSSYEFREVYSPKEMNLTYTRTMIPPKKFFLRARCHRRGQCTQNQTGLGKDVTYMR